MAIQSNHVFINLPVKDLDRSMQFFGDIGFEFNEQMTDKKVVMHDSGQQYICDAAC